MDNEIRDKAQFFFNKNITVHATNLEGSFFNGLILEIHDTMIVIKDRLFGETPISFSNIKKIERFRFKKEVGQ